MTIYTKTTDFQAKDALASGNPLKIVKGTEIDNEFDAIAAADATNLKKDGTVTATGNIPMGTYKFTGLGSGSAATDSANLGQVQAGAYQLIGSISGVDTITGSLSPAISSYAAGQKFSFVSAGANTGAVTININGLGAKSITKLGTTALAAGDIPSGAIVEIEYDGTQFQLCNLVAQSTQTISSSAVLGSGVTGTTQSANDNSTKIATTEYVDRANIGVTGSFKNLAASAGGASANVSVTADEIVVKNTSSYARILSSVSLTINTAGSGANGLDTGTLATSTWYSVWVICKNDGTTAGLISTSATSPTMPADYTFKARIGWIRTDSTANKYPLAFRQFGRRVRYAPASGANITALPLAASGAAGAPNTPTWVAVSVSNFVPSTTSFISLSLSIIGSGVKALCAPNNNYGAYNSTTNPPPMMAGAASVANVVTLCNYEMGLESTNVYWASETGGVLAVTGWEDNL